MTYWVPGQKIHPSLKNLIWMKQNDTSYLKVKLFLLLIYFWVPALVFLDSLGHHLVHVFSDIPDTLPEGCCVLTSSALLSKTKKWTLWLLANNLENKLKMMTWSWVLDFGSQFWHKSQSCSQFLSLWKLGSMEGQETKMLTQFWSPGSKLHRWIKC